MRELGWEEAQELAFNYKDSDKVTAIFFVDPLCDVCNEFVFNGVKNIAEKHEDDYDLVYVKEISGMPFPPTSTPTAPPEKYFRGITSPVNVSCSSRI